MPRKPSFFVFEIGEYGIRVTATRDLFIEGAKTKREFARQIKAVKADLDETAELAKAALKKYT